MNKIKINSTLIFTGENKEHGEYRTTIVVEDIYLSNVHDDHFQTIIKYKATYVSEKKKTEKTIDTINLDQLNREIDKYKPTIL